RSPSGRRAGGRARLRGDRVRRRGRAGARQRHPQPAPDPGVGDRGAPPRRRRPGPPHGRAGPPRHPPRSDRGVLHPPGLP
ncbi:MAG: glycosyltransferase family 2 protein, partial [Actinobacteria bacterium]|nr:glycosyltransferase family 2 protein [Actinomycetota bacterium]NIS29191.1 glycosyltransferase family 2 protein [Actinomycetota bacterium]NIT97649.1 glycosyltransferase family 2 protein [Actinomycetota bacterium]NIU21301.1 glycosyltransferase family 2 protein [Actinomycetota bacterium]NIU64592.1 glycosyltransferase family 2 protein [Actinomycetota bacterium]